jgi:hypothetical protein
MRIKYLFLVFGVLILPLTSFAHSGSTDSSGGDYCWTDCESYGLHTGEYHYHDESGNAILTYDNNPDLYDLDTAKRLHGNILLQVEERGEAWYVRSYDSKRYYMKDGDTAYQMMRFFSLGITDSDLSRIPEVKDTTEMNSSASICKTNSFTSSLAGEILLQVQQHGEAWYVDPAKCLRIYLKDGSAAYEIMRYLGLGITNKDLEKVVVGSWQTNDEEEVKENEQTKTEDVAVKEEEPSSQEKTEQQTTEPEKEPLSYSFSGTGSDVTKTFHLNEGLVLVTSTHTNGDSNFITELLDSKGNTEAYLTNEIGEYEGTSSASIKSSGDFVLNIRADGNWKFEIVQPVIKDFDETPAHYFGESDDVVGPFYLEAGLHTFDMYHLGDSNFIVELLNEDGKTEDYLANEIGVWSGVQAAGVDKNGYYYLSVTGDLYWSVDIDKEN